jgi:phage shock protein A
MREMQQHVEFVNHQMDKMQQHVDFSEGQLREMEQRVKIVENQLLAIQNSESWKAVQFLSRVRGWFVKNGQ